jgi:thioredoxin-dependent peroxiredoxin
VKTPIVAFAQRYTFVIGEGRKILKVESGKDAVDPAGAVAACPLRKPALKPEATPP